MSSKHLRLRALPLGLLIALLTTFGVCSSLHAQDKPPEPIANSLGMQFVRIPKGTFLMGSPAEEKYRNDDEQQHKVEITKDFLLGIHEVTQADFAKVMGYNPSCYSLSPKGKPGVKYNVRPGQGAEKLAGLDTGRFPVENVSWNEAVEFCEKLSQLPAEKKAGRTYRLPTEAQWEYACRAGSREYRVFHFGNEVTAKLANCGISYFPRQRLPGRLSRTTTVGSYKPNAFGLHDMHGNVAEFCSDWYSADYYPTSPAQDPTGPATGTHHVSRGGHRQCVSSACRSASRSRSRPDSHYYQSGFRVVCDVAREPG